ncbi:MAG TPA: DUF294 nucleotidyltransferase-like domain-containing protein, partial [Pirellulales bacterium]|nr:DUF294 nucleotidyltransferase-like domain-containing protein [Pirellulales bacterium]
MTTMPIFRDSLLAGRKRLAEGRSEIRQQHEAGSPGIQVSTRLAELLDKVVLDLFESAVSDVWPDADDAARSQVALVAHGGYGRRDVAPYSDVDLMILHAPGSEKKTFPLASRLTRDLYDVGLEVGQSVRAPRDALRLAARDPTACTSLMESRFLAGGKKLFETFAGRFDRRTRARPKNLFKAIEDA